MTLLFCVSLPVTSFHICTFSCARPTAQGEACDQGLVVSAAEAAEGRTKNGMHGMHRHEMRSPSMLEFGEEEDLISFYYVFAS